MLSSPRGSSLCICVSCMEHTAKLKFSMYFVYHKKSRLKENRVPSIHSVLPVSTCDVVVHAEGIYSCASSVWHWHLMQVTSAKWILNLWVNTAGAHDGQVDIRTGSSSVFLMPSAYFSDYCSTHLIKLLLKQLPSIKDTTKRGVALPCDLNGINVDRGLPCVKIVNCSKRGWMILSPQGADLISLFKNTQIFPRVSK